MKFIHAAGTPFEIGKIHGNQARDEVLCSLATYQQLFTLYAGLEWEEVKRRALAFLDNIHAFSPDLIQEMKGVAEGAGVPFEDILVLNTRSEILFSGKTGEADPVVDGCTAIAVAPELTADNHLYHGQNWDWVPVQEKAVFVMRIVQMGKPTILMLTEGGIIGKIGMNSAGVGLTLNAMSVPGAAQGVPLHVMLRGILDSYSLADAQRRLVEHRCACAANFLLSTRDGDALDIEVAAGDYDVLYADDGILVHTNHFVSERLKASFRDLNRDHAVSTHLRRGRAGRLLRQLGRPITAQDIANVFRDHVGAPDAICNHPDYYVAEPLRGATVATILMDMTVGEMAASVGRPCENLFQYFKL